MNPIINYYNYLEISPNASDLVVRAAYKSLAQRYHPDKYQGNKLEAENFMKKINEAYRILSDEKLRQEYDKQFQAVEKQIYQNEIYDQATKIVKDEYKKYQDTYTTSSHSGMHNTKKLILIMCLLIFGVFSSVIYMHKHQISNLYEIGKNLIHWSDPNAQVRLGFLYQSEDSFIKSSDKSIYWYSQAAKSGNAQAQYNLGVIYYQGKLVPQDYAKAFNLFSESASQNYYFAQYNLAIMYNKGQGVKKDKKWAQYWFYRAVSQKEDN